MTPVCCGMDAFLNVVSPTLSFYVCKECKREVLPLPAPLKDEDEMWFLDQLRPLFPED